MNFEFQNHENMHVTLTLKYDVSFISLSDPEIYVFLMRIPIDKGSKRKANKLSSYFEYFGIFVQKVVEGAQIYPLSPF